jgi:AcrR family transcriptional regulator
MTETATTAASRRARSRKGQGALLREEILDATERLLIETGSSEAVSIRAVAEAVGVTPPSIYRHFPDKVTLVFEVSNRRCQAIDDEMAEALEGVEEPLEGLAVLGRAYVDFGLRNPEPYRLVFMDTYTDEPEAFREERVAELPSFARAVEWVGKAIDAGLFRPEHADPLRVATGLWAAAHGLTSLLIAMPTFPWPGDDFVDEHLGTYLRGLLADRAGPRSAGPQASSGSADQSRSGDT